MDPRAPRNGLSLVSGVTEPPLFSSTLGQLLDQQAAKYHDKEAVLIGWTRARLTYHDLSLRTKELARGLLGMGVGAGDRVAVFSGDDERFVELFFAVARVGACLVILNKTYTASECLRALRHGDPCVFFLSDEVNRRPTLPLLQQLRKDKHGINHVVMMRWDLLPHRLEPTWDSVLEAARSVDASELEETEKSVDPMSTVNIQFTSGTTGSPKAAMLTHYGLSNNGFFMGEYLKLHPDDILCCGPPLFHCFGLIAGMMATITHGACIGFGGRDFDAPQVVDMLLSENCTALHGVPTMFTAIMEHMSRTGAKINTIKKGIAAGSKVPPAIVTEISDKLGYEHVGITYGMTETSPASFMTEVSDSPEDKLETVGRVMPHTAAKIVDGEGRIVPIGQRGEICVSGYLLQEGYYKAPDKTAEVMIPDENGVVWMHTGDEGIMDDRGYVKITGRLKDIIIRGGENIYPLEIEERLLQHASISQALVVAVKDARYGEAVAACLGVRPGHPKPPDEEVRAWVGKELARQKVPQHILWVGIDEAIKEYPITGSGKVRKDILSTLANAALAHPTAKL